MKRALLTVLALGAFIVENSFDFVGSVPYFLRLTGGLGILDMLPLPDPARAHRALALLGPDGRRQYAVLLATFEVLFPLTLPWATLALDYSENIGCGVLVATFPNESARVASLAGVLTTAKFVGYAACLAALLSMAAGSTIRAIGKRRQGSPR